MGSHVCRRRLTKTAAPVGMNRPVRFEQRTGRFSRLAAPDRGKVLSAEIPAPRFALSTSPSCRTTLSSNPSNSHTAKHRKPLQAWPAVAPPQLFAPPNFLFSFPYRQWHVPTCVSLCFVPCALHKTACSPSAAPSQPVHQVHKRSIPAHGGCPFSSSPESRRCPPGAPQPARCRTHKLFRPNHPRNPCHGKR